MHRDERISLVLQGGGALGSYQAGVYQALEEAGHAPEWLAGISIGAINAAIIAGNAPADRVAQLRAFWDLVSSQLTAEPLFPEGWGRRLFNEVSAALAASDGVPGFFKPRFCPPAFLAPEGTDGARSLYDTGPLRETLLDLIDFDRINAREIRLSLGAVQIETGNFEYFDNHQRKIAPEHIMASGALPPGFPPVWIDGIAYWDGGLVSNTPLQYVLDTRRGSAAMTVFQVDLFSARGPMPKNLFDVMQREKDIRYSSRTRFNTDVSKLLMKYHEAAQRLLERYPDLLKDDPDIRMLAEVQCDGPITIMHLINRSESYESHSKDYEFSRATVNGHWQSGYADTTHSLRHKRWVNRKPPRHGIAVYDLGSASP